MAVLPRLITLDSTGTLMRLARPVGELYRSALLSVSPSLGAVMPAPEALTRGFLREFRRLEAEVPCFGAGTEGGCRQFWCRVVRNTMVAAGVPPTSLEGEPFARGFGALYDDVFAGGKAWELLPTTLPALTDLRRWCDGSGCRLGVVSNMDDRLPAVLRELGIISTFDFVLTSYQCGAEKPSPVIFAAARRLAGIGEDAPALHCGDSPKRDAAGALRSGFAAVLLDAEAGALEPHGDLPAEGGCQPQCYRAPHIGHILDLLAEPGREP